MPTDLHARAIQQEIASRKLATELADALAAARREVDRRHPDPGSVLRDDWATELGASQHVDVARAELGTARTAEAAIRASLATVTTTGDAATYEDQLRDLLVEDASLRIALRHAEERLAAGRAAVEGYSALAVDTEAGVGAAAARAAWGEEHQELGLVLRAGLTQPPLDTIVADAAALLGAAAFSDANDRLDELLPAELRARATERYDEAAALLEAAAAHHATATGALDTLDSAGAPLAAARRAAEATFLEAEAALRAYVVGAATELEAAGALLAVAAAHPPLSAAQVAALAAAANPDGVTAASAESDLADALADLTDVTEDVEDAILAALVDDPDTDPETVQAVIDARAAVADPGVQGPVTTARAVYDAAARDALDAWEVEVPASLWDVLAGFLQAERALNRLADQAARDGLVQELDGAQDALASALDDLDVAVRSRWTARGIEVERRARLAAAEATAVDRAVQYLRGDGPGGRTAMEL